MTFYDKYMADHPEYDEFPGYVISGCPCDNGYETALESAEACQKNPFCHGCWNRQAPEDETYTDMARKTHIIITKGNWKEVVNDCRATVGKTEIGKVPSVAFKKRILIAEHSPIRDISIKWKWPNIPHWVGVHFSRHKWECFIQTQRSDRTGKPREKLPQDEPQTFTGEANVQHLIDTSRKRLCMQASPETREYMEDLKATIAEYEPEISDVMVPNCIYRCGCPEMGKCGYFEKLSGMNPAISSTNIQERYDAYNAIFWKDREGK